MRVAVCAVRVRGEWWWWWCACVGLLCRLAAAPPSRAPLPQQRRSQNRSPPHPTQNKITCPDVSREEIINACGVDDVHDGVNYVRTACVIAVSKV